MKPVHITVAAAALTFFAAVMLRRAPPPPLPPMRPPAAPPSAVALLQPPAPGAAPLLRAPALPALPWREPSSHAWQQPHHLLPPLLAPLAQTSRPGSPADWLCVVEFFMTKAAADAKCTASACRVFKAIALTRQPGYVCMHRLPKTCKATTPATRAQVCCVLGGFFARTALNADRCTQCLRGQPALAQPCEALAVTPPPPPSPTPPPPPLDRCNATYHSCGSSHSPYCCATHDGRAIVRDKCVCTGCWGGWGMHMAFCTSYHNFHEPFDCKTCKPGAPVCCVTILGYRSLGSKCECECHGGMVKSEGACPAEGKATPDLRNTW